MTKKTTIDRTFAKNARAENIKKNTNETFEERRSLDRSSNGFENAVRKFANHLQRIRNWRLKREDSIVGRSLERPGLDLNCSAILFD